MFCLLTPPLWDQTVSLLIFTCRCVFVSVPPLGDYLASSGVVELGAGSPPGDLYEVAPSLCWQ